MTEIQAQIKIKEMIEENPDNRFIGFTKEYEKIVFKKHLSVGWYNDKFGDVHVQVLEIEE